MCQAPTVQFVGAPDYAQGEEWENDMHDPAKVREIGLRARQARKALGLNQTEAARLIGGQSHAIISDLERGRQLPMELDELATGLRVSPWWLRYGIVCEGHHADLDLALLRRIRALSPQMREHIIAMIEHLT